jgi:hypothetical protein
VRPTANAGTITVPPRAAVRATMSAISSSGSQGSRRRWPHDRVGAVAQVAAEQQPPTAGGHDDAGRAEDMAGAAPRRFQAVAEVQRPAEVDIAELLEAVLGVGARVQRTRRAVLGEPVAIGELGVLFVDEAGVREQMAAQRVRRARAVDRPLESLRGQPRQVSGVVDVGMRQQHPVQRGDVERQRPPVALAQLLVTLEQAAVDQ